MLKFSEYNANPTATVRTALEAGDLLREFTVSPSTAKIAALGILMTRIRQLDHTVSQDKTASAAIKALSSELFWLASLVTISIGAISDTAKTMSSR